MVLAHQKTSDTDAVTTLHYIEVLAHANAAFEHNCFKLKQALRQFPKVKIRPQVKVGHEPDLPSPFPGGRSISPL